MPVFTGSAVVTYTGAKVCVEAISLEEAKEKAAKGSFADVDMRPAKIVSLEIHDLELSK